MSLLANHGLIEDIGLQVQLVSSGAAVAVGAGSVSMDLPYPAITFGLLLARIAVRETGPTPAAPLGWTLLYADTDGSFIKHYIFFKYSTGDVGNITFGWGVACGNVIMGQIHTIQNSMLTTPFDESGGLIIGSLTYGPASITSTRRRSLAVSFAMLPGPGVYATGAYTGNVGGTWVERTTANSLLGSDVTIQLQTAILPIAGTISGGSFAADTGGLSLTRSFCIKSNL